MWPAIGEGGYQMIILVYKPYILSKYILSSFKSCQIRPLIFVEISFKKCSTFHFVCYIYTYALKKTELKNIFSYSNNYIQNIKHKYNQWPQFLFKTFWNEIFSSSHFHKVRSQCRGVPFFVIYISAQYQNVLKRIFLSLPRIQGALP